MSSCLPVSIDKRVKDSEISFDGNRNCHEDAASQKNVMERVEKVGEKLMM